MRKILIAALVASAAFAAPAAAQSVTGTVIINGNVPSKCTVTNGSSATAFGATVNMGDLSDTDLTLLPSATLSNTFNTVGGAGLSARVVCTTANPTIAVNADPLVAATATAASGYANTVHFQADVAVTKVGGSQTYSNDSDAVAGTATALGDRLSAAAGNNIVISTSNWRTLSTGNEVLAYDPSYSGQIVVTIAPI